MASAKKKTATHAQMPLDFSASRAAAVQPRGQVVKFAAGRSASQRREEQAVRLLLDKASRLTW